MASARARTSARPRPLAGQRACATTRASPSGSKSTSRTLGPAGASAGGRPKSSWAGARGGRGGWVLRQQGSEVGAQRGQQLGIGVEGPVEGRLVAPRQLRVGGQGRRSVIAVAPSRTVGERHVAGGLLQVARQPVPL